MHRCEPRINVLLSEDHLEKMHQGVLKVLEKTGVAFPYPDLIKKITSNRNVFIREGRVCFKPDFIQDIVEKQRKKQPVKNNRQKVISLIAGSHAHHFVDSGKDEILPLKTDDLIRMTKLIDALLDLNVYGGAPGAPEDVHPSLRPLAQYMISCRYSRHGRTFYGIPERRIIPFLFEMKKVMEDPFDAGIHFISPLKIEGNEFESFLYLVENRYPVRHVSITSMPMLGVTAPVFCAGAFIQACAEAIGGAAIVSLLAEQIEVNFSINAYAFDHKHATIVYGSPENNLLELIQMGINRYYGLSRGGRFIRTMAKRPGIQSAMEISASATIGALAGARSFSGAGLISLDEVFSPEQLILCCEVRDYVTRLAEGFDFDEENFSLDIIDEVAKTDGNFLIHPSTLENHKKIFWNPVFLDRNMLAKSQHENDEKLRKRLTDFAIKKNKQYNFAFDEYKSQELDRIYKAAEKIVNSGG